MDQINERIKQIRTHLNMTQIKFCKEICISQSSLGEIETGVRKVNDRIIQLISSQFNINKDWIKTGKGAMYSKEKADIRLEHLIELYKQLNEPLQKYLIEQTESLLKLHNENTIKKK